ncbi:hypothetical protein [Chondromyces apiculatus]|uniref:Uncharacterized protein n=1 Tax=Chondromyces apiculatus DSM 436 TaxID=1192034 RepID=A0A017T7F3_9BACT|nr:hypothetical protein [Chondromyces apiculatus]EYF04506.1 Hypothetical protein CAP_4474 [Chondromyces apiculatus DSM 436]
MDPSVKAQRALLHPLWLLSLTLLVVNDHLLKGSGLLPGWMTGKLSDFAGLIVAPALLAALLRLSSKGALIGAHLATGAVFAAINLSPAFARAVEGLMALTPFPWVIVVDAEDLIALPALFAAWQVLVPAMRAEVDERPILHRVAAVAGGMACMATSMPDPCDEDPSQCIPTDGPAATEIASLVLGNDTEEQRVVRVRPLKESVEVDCLTMLADPTRTLSREMFGPAETWLLEPGRALPLQNSTCDAYLVDADGLPMQLLAWSAGQFPAAMLSTETRAPDEGRMIFMRMDEALGRLELAEHVAVHDAPPVEQPAPGPGCAPLPDTVGVAWSAPPVGGAEITAIDSSPDGCHRFTLLSEGGEAPFYLCVPEGAQPFQVGDALKVETLDSSFTAPETKDEASFAEGVFLSNDTVGVMVVRGNMVARQAFAFLPTPAEEPSISADEVPSCTGSHDACGNLVIPLEVSLLGGSAEGATFLRAGQSAELADGYGTLHVVRAEELPIRDTECAPSRVTRRHFESVLVIPLTPATP